jgi:hypothetical protein
MADGTQADENPALSQSLHMVLIHHMTSIWLVEMINWDSDHRRNDKLGKPLGCNIHVVLIQSDQIFVCGIESKALCVVRVQNGESCKSGQEHNASSHSRFASLVR